MTKHDLAEYIKRRFGEPTIKCELSHDQIYDALALALRWFNANKGGEKRGQVTIAPGVSEYTLPAEVRAVYRVYFVEEGLNGLLGGMADVMQDFGWAPGLVPMPRGKLPAFSGVVQYLQKMDQVHRIAAREPGWEFTEGKLLVYPKPTDSMTGPAFYDYKVDYTDIPQLAKFPLDEDMVVRRTFAECKETLGRIRSKYSAYPAAEGTVSLDGAALLAESKDEKTVLDTEIIEKALPVPGGFLVG